MSKFFLHAVFLLGVLLAFEIVQPEAVQAQCFHLGQAFDCKGLPEGTSSDHFNPDGSITLSNGQIVPGNFFDTPFIAPVASPISLATTFVTPIVPQGPALAVLFPTTIDGINSLTALSHPFDMHGFSESVEWNWETVAQVAKLLTVDENTYKGTSLTFNKRLANRWLLRGNFAWQDWEWNISNNPRPYSPEEAKKLLDDAGWKIGESGIREHTPDNVEDQINRQIASALSYYLSTSSFGRHDIKIVMEPFQDARSENVVLFHEATQSGQLMIKLFPNDYIFVQTPDITGLGEGAEYTFKLKDSLVLGNEPIEGPTKEPLKFGAGYKDAEVADAHWPGEGQSQQGIVISGSQTYEPDFLLKGEGLSIHPDYLFIEEEYEVARSVSLGVRVTAGFDPNGNWILKVPYNQYVKALADSQTDSTGSKYNQDTLIKGNLTENVGPSFSTGSESQSLTPDRPWGFNFPAFAIKDTKFLAPLIEKTVYQMDYQTAPIPEFLETKVTQPELPQSEVFTPQNGYQNHKDDVM